MLSLLNVRCVTASSAVRINDDRTIFRAAATVSGKDCLCLNRDVKQSPWPAQTSQLHKAFLLLRASLICRSTLDSGVRLTFASNKKLPAMDTVNTEAET
jgi:hypothetical protein